MKLPFEMVSIDGFRGLCNLQLDKMGAINVLVGANNSGKTSVLEALSIMCNPFRPAEWLDVIRRRDFGGLDETYVQSLRWCFRQEGRLVDPEFTFESSCKFTSYGRFELRQLKVEYRDIEGSPDERELRRMRNLFPERGDSDNLWRGAQVSHFVNMDMSNRQKTLFDPNAAVDLDPVEIQVWEKIPLPLIPSQPRRTRHAGLATETLTPYSYQMNGVLVRAHSRRMLHLFNPLNEGKDLTVQLIREFDPDVIDVKVASLRGERPALYLIHRKLGPAPLSIFGDALRRAVLLATTLQRVEGGLLLIDEIEAGIHISALKKVFDWLFKVSDRFNVQIVATTHSLEAVDSILAASGDRIADLVTFHLENNEGKSEAKRISGELLQRLRRERGLDVR